MIGFRWLWLLLIVVAAPLGAQNFPRLTGRVVDQANIIPATNEARLTAQLETLERDSGRQLVVATVSSLEGMDIDQYGPLLGRDWKIGTSVKDDGVILLIAPNERKMRIDAGYGAGAFLTDLVAGRIIRDTITPLFKAGDYPGGVQAGVDSIAAWMKLPPDEAARRAQAIGASEAQRGQSDKGGFPFILVFFLLFFVIIPLLRRAAGKRYHSGKRRRDGVDPWVVLWGLNELSKASRGGGSSWGGGGFGGGGGGFSGGGGSFGGGGASGGW